MVDMEGAGRVVDPIGNPGVELVLETPSTATPWTDALVALLPAASVAAHVRRLMLAPGGRHLQAPST
jgi:hypothetical protein